jgi:hypothetical protein
MSSVLRTSTGAITDTDIAFQLTQQKWKTVDIGISDTDLKAHFRFFDDAVIIRSSREGVPLMTTSGIYGPIPPHTKVQLTPGQGTGVTIVSEGGDEVTLLEQLQQLQDNSAVPDENNATTIAANWVSGRDGGNFPGLSGSANIFGSTGSLFIKQQTVAFPVLDVNDPVLDPDNHTYAKTLAYYGARRLLPGEAFSTGFDDLLWGMEYDTNLPDYIRNYALQPSGGGGMFVEHHAFPHIFLPRPAKDEQVFCEAKVTLGRNCTVKLKDASGIEVLKPQFRFTTFRIPADGSAIAILPGTIHNDSFTNGKLTVFVADVTEDKVDTVALRETAPFTNISLQEMAVKREGKMGK